MPRHRPLIDYTSFREWKRDRRISNEKLAEQAKKYGAPVSPKTIGTAISEGLPLHGRVLIAWQGAFGWTRQEMLHLCMGGEPVRCEEEEGEEQ